MVHQFDVEVLLAVDVLQFAGGAQRLVELPQAQAHVCTMPDGQPDPQITPALLYVASVLVHARIAHHTALGLATDDAFVRLTRPSSLSAHNVRWV